MVQPFNLTPLDVIDVHRALKQLDSNKSTVLDKLDPYFLKLAVELIAEPLTLTLSNNWIPNIWKSAYVLPLLKGEDPSVVKNQADPCV